MGRRIVIDMTKQPPPAPPKPDDYPPCARPQGLPPTLKATIGDAIAKKKGADRLASLSLSRLA